MYQISCKYAPKLLAPANALPLTIGELCITLDGVRCELRYVMGWDNRDDRYVGELDDTCGRIYGCPFSAIRSIWFGRLGYVGDYWYLVEMIKK